MLNPEVPQIFKTCTKLISYVRSFLDNLDFLEVYYSPQKVRTPMMNMIARGAAARPFVTHLNELNMKLYMSISPGLYLKRLIIGGFGRVYEIGGQFRNEGIDLTHNPEFTTCEFYMAHADYYDLMELTEKMLSGMVKEIIGGYKIYHANGLENDRIEIDFIPPFRRIDMISELEKMANLSIPKDLSSDEANKYLVDACAKFEVKCPIPKQHLDCWISSLASIKFVVLRWGEKSNLSSEAERLSVYCYQEIIDMGHESRTALLHSEDASFIGP